jgi:hypothetical protein
MARMHPSGCPTAKGGAPIAAAERLLFERLAAELDAGWSVVHDCALRAAGESGTVDFLLIHAGFGVALLGLAEPDGAADPEAAVAAMRTMLGEIGFTRRFHGEPPVVARTLRGDEPGKLVDLLFAGARASAIGDPTWPEWLVHRLTESRDAIVGLVATPSAVDPGPRLRGPSREEAWRVSAAGVREAAGMHAPAAARDDAGRATGAQVPSAPIGAVSQAPPQRATLWPGMGFAAVVVAAVLVGMAMLSHGNGPARSVATDSAPPPQ